MITEFKQLDELKNLNNNIREASAASGKNSKAINYLTGALVFLALAQLIIAVLTYNDEQDKIKIKKQCYQSVLKTSDIDLNYKSCLRKFGLSN